MKLGSGRQLALVFSCRSVAEGACSCARIYARHAHAAGACASRAAANCPTD